MQNYIAPGDVLEVVAAAALTSGQGVLVGSMLGISAGSAAIGAKISVVVEGVFSLPKRTDPTTAAMPQGSKVYWDDTAKVIDNVVGTGPNNWIGWAYATASSTAATVQVRLLG